MFPVLMGVLKRYVPIITLPFAGLVGFIGSNMESWISDYSTPSAISVDQQRADRFLKNIEIDSKMNDDDDHIVSPKKHVPFEVNLSPSLS